MQYVMPSSNSKLVMDLVKALNGETNAIHFYEHLAQLAPNEDIRNRILEIRQDEIRHFNGFAYIFTCLTGQQASPQLTEPLPTDFKTGVITAFNDEQNTVDFYHKVARESTIPFISNEFRSNAADEQNHAVWFLYFMNYH